MSDLLQLERQRQEIAELVELRDAALRLSENRDFRKLFIDLYFKDEAARLVQVSSDPIITKEQREDALAMAQATGHTKRYLSMIVLRGNTVAGDIEDLELQIEEARREDELQVEAEEGQANGGAL